LPTMDPRDALYTKVDAQCDKLTAVVGIDVFNVQKVIINVNNRPRLL